MADLYMLRQMAEAKASIARLAPNLLLIQKQTEEASRFARQIKAMTSRLASPFDTAVLQDRTWTFIQKVAEDYSRIAASIEQGREDDMLISATLPKRGWYLSGQEPCTLSSRLAKAVRANDWEKVDQEMMKYLPQFELEPLREWLAQENVPDYCISRLCRFLRHHNESNFEEAVYLGVPLLDEISMYLYSGKAFTTKRNKQPRPGIAIRTSTGPELTSYCESFVQIFGSLQIEVEPKHLADEDYWNRHAIVHGLMKRSMGVKDSAKCLMAIGFLIFARKEMEDTDYADSSESNSTIT